MAVRWSPAGIIAVLFISVFSFYLLRETVLPVFSPLTDSEQISIRELVCASIIAAERGGAEVKRVHEAQVLNARSKDKAPKNPVTDGDLRSHLAMERTLKLAFRGLKVISEEHTTEEEAGVPGLIVGSVEGLCPREVLEDQALDRYVDQSEIQLWIDPLDATQEYTENLLNYVTTMVGIAIKGTAVAGVIHKPFETDDGQRTFWAWKDWSQSANLFKTVGWPVESIVVSRSHPGDVEEIAKNAFGANPMKVVPAGGAGFKALQVLLGNASLYLHTTKIKKWDLCAPNGIFNAVGGRLTTLDGKSIDYTAPKKAGDEVNHGGVLASLRDHPHYVKVMQALKSTPKSPREDS